MASGTLAPVPGLVCDGPFIEARDYAAGVLAAGVLAAGVPLRDGAALPKPARDPASR